jgi:hypothetical protein
MCCQDPTNSILGRAATFFRVFVVFMTFPHTEDGRRASVEGVLFGPAKGFPRASLQSSHEKVSADFLIESSRAG